MTTRSVCSPESRWRPIDLDGPVCGYKFDDDECAGRGSHYCEPRADRVVAFFRELLVHTKGPYARKAFVLEEWQELGIIRPIFGEVVWSREWDRYVRRYRVVYVVMARKNGKSELVAGMLLYLLVGDDEESAELYGAAKDTKQAGKVWEPAWRMVQLSPTLRSRLKVNQHSRRIYDERTASYYEVITSDALGELGHNPHGFVLDEALSQPDDSLWNAMRTAAGTRTQAMMALVTTETDDPVGFGAAMIDEAERIQADPTRTPHAFAFVRKTPKDADPWDERSWAHANPALGQFLSLEALRQEALEARNDPTKENAFRQYRLNQRQQQTTRYVPMHVWDSCIGEVAASPTWLDAKAAGHRCFGGLDLSATTDMTALCWEFPDVTAQVGDHVFHSLSIWRFWLPEDMVSVLDDYTAGKASVWVRDGWITPTEGNVIDYDAIYDQVQRDRELFKVADISADRWLLEPVRQEIAKRGVEVYGVGQGFRDLSSPTKDLMRQLKSRSTWHGGNPVARWHADSVEVKQDDAENIKPVKPARGRSGKRIDGFVARILARDGVLRRGSAKARAYYAY